jgi:glycosyltransferase involved in cell wall biosynthesis
MKNKKIRLLIDGVFYQIAKSGICRVWSSIITRLLQRDDLQLFFLDRGNAPVMAGVEYIPFPSYQFQWCAQDSVLIQGVCDAYGIDVFTTTYYTTPLSTPMFLMVYDMIPEVLGFDLSQRGWTEKEIAISFSREFICISENTARDLVRFYPSIKRGSIVVSHCGVEASVFGPKPPEVISEFKRQHNLTRPYYIIVGDREQHRGYKNAKLFFESLAMLEGADFDVLCVGGSKQIEPWISQRLPQAVNCQRVELSDANLSAAYAGARALIYPSLYEGFGMPVVEAMACGCPVITTKRGSLGEVAGDAACFVEGRCEKEMSSALIAMGKNAFRQKLIQLGFANAARFRWDGMVESVIQVCHKLIASRETNGFRDFVTEYERLRKIQGALDN